MYEKIAMRKYQNLNWEPPKVGRDFDCSTLWKEEEAMIEVDMTTLALMKSSRR